MGNLYRFMFPHKLCLPFDTIKYIYIWINKQYLTGAISH